MSDSVRPHRRQPTRLPHPWDSPGKNTGVGCHSLLQCMKVESESEVSQSCPTLSDPMDCSPPGPPSMGFSRQEYWNGVPLPSPSRKPKSIFFPFHNIYILWKYSWLIIFQLHSKVIELYIYAYIIFEVFSIIDYYKILTIVPCAVYSKSVLLVAFFF